MEYIGKIIDGAGKANKVSDKLHEARCQQVNANLVKGTLNIEVSDLEATVNSLGKPFIETDVDNMKLGSLRWWRITLTIKGIEYSDNTFIVRHNKTGTRYLEVMSQVMFRENGILNNDEVTFKRIDNTQT